MQLYTRTERLMGSIFSFGVITNDEKFAIDFLQLGVDEVIRLENLLSEYIPTSSTSRINQNAHHQWLSIDDESYQLLKRCHSISKLTEGDFDISVSPLKKLYEFRKQNAHLPTEAKLKSALKKVGYQNILFDDSNHRIKLGTNGMQISFAAIGKGYAADCVAVLWKKNGLDSGYVDASGDIRAIGLNQDGLAWKSGIANPDNLDSSILKIDISNAAIATSGASEQFFEFMGDKYSHNINPQTGRPVQYIKSVTVISPSAELSDALATAVYVKGTKDGLEFINQLPQTHAIIIDDDNKLHLSNNLNYENITTHTDALLCV